MKTKTAARVVTYTWRRDSGRASRTSRVPRWRSPAIAEVANPMAKIDTRMIEIGWM
jgi:hypothetical protein